MGNAAKATKRKVGDYREDLPPGSDEMFCDDNTAGSRIW